MTRRSRDLTEQRQAPQPIHDKSILLRACRQLLWLFVSTVPDMVRLPATLSLHACGTLHAYHDQGSPAYLVIRQNIGCGSSGLVRGYLVM